MPLSRLFKGDVAGYFEDNADAPDSFWVFLHIPKTAGTSFRAELARNLRPNANICVNAGGNPRLPRFDNVEAALEYFLTASLQEQAFRFASGHMLRAQVERISARCPTARLITMLRSPGTRVISDYRYQRTPKHPPHKEFIEQYPDLESYVRSPASHEKMFDFLRRGPDDTVDDVLHDLETNFAFVGLTEMYNLSRRVLFRLINCVPEAAEERNRTQAVAENDIKELKSVLPLIRELNRKDAAIHEHFRRKLREQRDAINVYLREHRVRTGRTALGRTASS